MPDKKNPGFRKLFQTAAEIKRKENDEKKAAELEKMQKQIAEDDKNREEYSHQLQKDKIEILRNKQNDNDISLNNTDNEKNKKYTVRQKISNFFYHNKWWLGIACFLVLTAGYLIYDAATKKNPDLSVMLVANDDELYSNSAGIKDFFGNYCGDRNNDGEVNVAIYYMPLSDYIKNNQPDMYLASSTQLTALLQSDYPLLVIADDESSEIFENDKLLLNLEKYHPENELVEENRFYLADTDFPDIIGYSEEKEVYDSIYLGIRKVTKGSSYEEKMRMNFENDFDILQQIISDLSEK